LNSASKSKFLSGSGHITIGGRAFINSGCVLYSGNGIWIGDNVLIGSNCSLVPTNHRFDDPYTKIIEQRFADSKGGVIIENDVWIGANVVLLDGTKIRRGAIIGANSLVKGEIEAFSINVGSPVKKLGVVLSEHSCFWRYRLPWKQYC
jgi:virginiamycin A acetyltransferase